MLNCAVNLLTSKSHVISRFARLQKARPLRQQSLLLATLLAYLVAGAIVPRGHMAAPLSSGTPFHLCPGDLRSALIIDRLSAGTVHHPHQHHHHADDSASVDSTSVDKTSADPGCSFAGFGTAIAQDTGTTDEPVATVLHVASRPSSGYRSGTWLRPPARSPPA